MEMYECTQVRARNLGDVASANDQLTDTLLACKSTPIIDIACEIHTSIQMRRVTTQHAREQENECDIILIAEHFERHLSAFGFAAQTCSRYMLIDLTHYLNVGEYFRI